MNEFSSSVPQPTASGPAPVKSPLIRVIGVGGAGLQAVAAMAGAGFAGVGFCGVHTDASRLANSPLTDKILLGANRTRGMGAGGDPEIGRAAAEEEANQLREMCAGCDLIILVAGLGKGTGSGAGPVVGRVARESGALVLALATLPFGFEGDRRQRQAHEALQQLKRSTDAVVCLPNQKVVGLIDENTTLAEMFSIANAMLADGVRGLWRLAINDGVIPVDFADLCRVVRGRQAESCFATAEARGESRAREVVEALLASPMLEAGRALGEADAVLVSLVGGTDLKQKEVSMVMEQINRLAERAEVVMGAACEPEFEGRLAVTLIAARRSESIPGMGRVGAAAAEEESGGLLTGDAPPDLALESPEGAGDRPHSRYVPPAPDLTPELRDRVLRQAGVSARQRRKAARLNQQLLPLDVVAKGRFAKSDPTVHDGEDLDTPTYIRRGVALN
ncbi:MAG: cell division protein FtsZ [Limisphaerales bacterium]